MKNILMKKVSWVTYTVIVWLITILGIVFLEVGCSHALVSNSYEEIITPAETSNITKGSTRSVIRIRKTDDGKVIVCKLGDCK